MKKFAFAFFVSTLSMIPAVQPVLAADVKVAASDILYDAEGKRLGSVYAVTSKGSPQVAVGMRIVTIPLSTISKTDGKLVTNMTKEEITARR